MRFHAILPVRDEADIIDQCVRHLLTWADAIYVFDTGSVDATWEIVQDWAAKDRRVIPLRKDPVYFSETHVRGWIFHHVRKHMRDGDWFLRSDADEFYPITPPEFVKKRMRKHETIAWYQYYNFQLTESEVKDWEEGRETLADRQRPIEERRRWFKPWTYSEPRLCRYRETMQWPCTISFPYNSGYVARERIPVRHYPQRDPVQLARRCRLRAVMMRDSIEVRVPFTHWIESEWRKLIVPNSSPDLRYWVPGESLPEYHNTNHLAKLHKRAVQRVLHACCLPMLDRLRPKWPEETYPPRIPAEAQAELEKQLRE